MVDGYTIAEVTEFKGKKKLVGHFIAAKVFKNSKTGHYAMRLSMPDKKDKRAIKALSQGNGWHWEKLK